MDSSIHWYSRFIDDPPGSSMPDLTKLAEQLVSRLSDSSRTIAVAESCSAGALANSLAQPERAGDVLFGGFVTYMVAAKISALGIPPTLIEEYSAVSRPVARAMAEGTLEHAPVDFALALTGVTGFVEDNRGNPRGRIFVAAATKCGRRLDCHCEFGPLPPAVLLDAALRTAISLGLELLKPA
jgi:PncC family amidohydrolase